MVTFRLYMISREQFAGIIVQPVTQPFFDSIDPKPTFALKRMGGHGGFWRSIKSTIAVRSVKRTADGNVIAPAASQLCCDPRRE
jgi:hypothetical protein